MKNYFKFLQFAGLEDIPKILEGVPGLDIDKSFLISLIHHVKELYEDMWKVREAYEEIAWAENKKGNDKKLKTLATLERQILNTQGLIIEYVKKVKESGE